jgi:hypothetical protein
VFQLEDRIVKIDGDRKPIEAIREQYGAMTSLATSSNERKGAQKPAAFIQQLQEMAAEMQPLQGDLSTNINSLQYVRYNDVLPTIVACTPRTPHGQMDPSANVSKHRNCGATANGGHTEIMEQHHMGLKKEHNT